MQRRATGQGRVKRVVWLLVALIALAGAGALYVRSAESDPARWHVDPTTRPSTGRPNEARVMPEPPADVVSPVFAMTPAELAERLDAVIRAEPRTARLAGGPTDSFATYVQRSALVGFPDYVSVRAVPAEGGAALAMWSRSRFGYGDMGVNRARLARWMAALAR